MKMTQRTQAQLDAIKKQLDEYAGNIDSCYDSISPTFTDCSIPAEGLYVVGLTQEEQDELLSQLDSAVMEMQQAFHDRMLEVLEDFYDEYIVEDDDECDHLITHADVLAGQQQAQQERLAVLEHMAKRLKQKTGLKSRKSRVA
jgi:hypothetical protein